MGSGTVSTGTIKRNCQTSEHGSWPSHFSDVPSFSITTLKDTLLCKIQRKKR
jgi:hypothetical protein